MPSIPPTLSSSYQPAYWMRTDTKTLTQEKDSGRDNTEKKRDNFVGGNTEKERYVGGNTEKEREMCRENAEKRETGRGNTDKDRERCIMLEVIKRNRGIFWR